MRFTIAALLSFLTCFGCSKSKDSNADEASFFRMKIDGTMKEFDSCWVVTYDQPGAGSQIYYQNNILCGKPGDYSGLYVNDITTIKAGVYRASTLNAASNTPMAGLGAHRNSGSDDIYISYQAGWPIYDVIVTITEYGSDYVTGTFSGKLRLLGGSTVLDVTEGEFKALR